MRARARVAAAIESLLDHTDDAGTGLRVRLISAHEGLTRQGSLRRNVERRQGGEGDVGEADIFSPSRTCENQSMSEKQLQRVRRLCLALPEASEKLSHGEPTFFVDKKVFVMFADNHHHDGHVAVWLPVPPGVQSGLIESEPGVFFKPPYVGVKGWVGIELDRISDEDLGLHIEMAWELIAPKRLVSSAVAAVETPRPKRKASTGNADARTKKRVR